MAKHVAQTVESARIRWKNVFLSQTRQSVPRGWAIFHKV